MGISMSSSASSSTGDTTAAPAGATLKALDLNLRTAARRGYLDLCRTLVSSGANVKAIDSKGQTALHHAVASDSPDVINFLIVAGCATDVVDTANKTALDLAVDAAALNATCALDAVHAKMNDHHAKLGWVQIQPWSNRCQHGPWNRAREYVPGTRAAREAMRAVLRLLCPSKDLPNEVSNLILDYAEFWHSESVFGGEETYVTERNSPKMHLQTDKLERPIKRVAFKIWSHDQGWTSWPQHRGSYKNCWSWFEAAKVLDDGEIVKGPRVAVNRHAVRQSELKLVTWSFCDDDQQDPKGEMRKWLKDLKPGDRIALMALARYPGWHNTVECAEIVTFSGL